MFLVRSTAKALGRESTLYGGGLLKGGRGLPDDLSQVSFRDGDLKVPQTEGAALGPALPPRRRGRRRAAGVPG